jgi:hypothetical protein
MTNVIAGTMGRATGSILGRLMTLPAWEAQIDDAVEAATKRGRTNGAVATMQDQRKARAAPGR